MKSRTTALFFGIVVAALTSLLIAAGPSEATTRGFSPNPTCASNGPYGPELTSRVCLYSTVSGSSIVYKAVLTLSGTGFHTVHVQLMQGGSSSGGGTTRCNSADVMLGPGESVSCSYKAAVNAYFTGQGWWLETGGYTALSRVVAYSY